MNDTESGETSVFVKKTRSSLICVSTILVIVQFLEVLVIYLLYLYRGSYMSAHVLLNLLNKLGKRDKMRGLPSILSFFFNSFNKFNYTRAQVLDSIYHMTLRLL